MACWEFVCAALRGKLTLGFPKWQHSKTLITHDLSAFSHCVISALWSHTLRVWFINVREVGMQVIHQIQFKETCQHVYSEKSGSLRSSRSAERKWMREKGSEGNVDKGQKKLWAFSWMRRTMKETGTFTWVCFSQLLLIYCFYLGNLVCCLLELSLALVSSCPGLSHQLEERQRKQGNERERMTQDQRIKS